MVCHRAPLACTEVKNSTKPMKFLDAVQLLLTSRASLEAKDENGCTALHRAAQADNSETTQGLLEAKADLSAEDECRWEALKEVSEGGKRKTCMRQHVETPKIHRKV